jgi:hypothetical protein
MWIYGAYDFSLASTLAWKEGNVSSFRQVGLAFLTVALIAGIAGCGTSGGSGSGSGPAIAGATLSTLPAAIADPLARLSATEVAKKAWANTKAATSVHLAGTVTDSGQTITISETIAHSGTECAGTYSFRGKGTVQVAVLGTTAWEKPDDAFWRSAGTPAAALPRVSGKWVLTSTSTAGKSGPAEMCSLSELIGPNVPTSPPDLNKDPITEPDGKVLSLELMEGAGGASFYVTDTAHPLITRVDSPHWGSEGSIKLTGYGAAVTITPPPASEVITANGLVV